MIVTACWLYWLIRRHTAALFEAQELSQLAYDAANLGTWQHDFKTDTTYLDQRAHTLWA